MNLIGTCWIAEISFFDCSQSAEPREGARGRYRNGFGFLKIFLKLLSPINLKVKEVKDIRKYSMSSCLVTKSRKIHIVYKLVYFLKVPKNFFIKN